MPSMSSTSQPSGLLRAPIGRQRVTFSAAPPEVRTYVVGERVALGTIQSLHVAQSRDSQLSGGHLRGFAGLPRRILILFSGPAGRVDGLAAHLRRLGFEVVEIDTKVGGAAHDCSKRRVAEWLLACIAAGMFCAVFAAPPCSSFSVAHDPALRSDTHVRGVDPMPPEWRAYIDKHNALPHVLCRPRTLSVRSGWSRTRLIARTKRRLHTGSASPRAAPSFACRWSCSSSERHRRWLPRLRSAPLGRLHRSSQHCSGRPCWRRSSPRSGACVARIAHTVSMPSGMIRRDAHCRLRPRLTLGL
jgi:hypothetical protein